MITTFYYFYPRSPCGERPRLASIFSDGAKISIHALLAESDESQQLFERPTRDFYPRSPCGERPFSMYGALPAKIFLSTLSLRRATVSDIYKVSEVAISIHALLAESDGILPHHSRKIIKFLSTLSLRRATAKVHKTVGHFCAYETNFMEIASSC